MSLFLVRGHVRDGVCGRDCGCRRTAGREAAVLRAAMPAAIDLARSALRARAFREYGLDGACAPRVLEDSETASRESALVRLLEPVRDSHHGPDLCSALMRIAVRDAARDLHWLPGVTRAVHEMQAQDWSHLLRPPS